jgi:hypothetical protein
LSIETTTGMSPPPIEATRCQPRARASAVTATSSQIDGVAYQTVSTRKSARAPMLRAFLPGSMSGFDDIRPESLRKATIDPVKVTAPMKTPMNTSA